MYVSSACGLRMDEQLINLQASGKMVDGDVQMSYILVVNPCSKERFLHKNVCNGVTTVRIGITNSCFCNSPGAILCKLVMYLAMGR